MRRLQRTNVDDKACLWMLCLVYVVIDIISLYTCTHYALHQLSSAQLSSAQLTLLVTSIIIQKPCCSLTPALSL